jgi:hypothetical protein
MLFYAYKSYKNFRIAYPNIEIWANLVNNKDIVEMHFQQIKDRIFKILKEANLKSGIINYNSDYSSIEIKDGEFNNIYNLDDIVLIGCKLNGEITNCRIFESKIDNSILKACKIYQSSLIENSKLNDCYVSDNSSLVNFYIAGGSSVILGDLNKGIFRAGNLTKWNKENAIDVEFIDYKIIK